jgi:hypothetical protein
LKVIENEFVSRVTSIPHSRSAKSLAWRASDNGERFPIANQFLEISGFNGGKVDVVAWAFYVCLISSTRIRIQFGAKRRFHSGVCKSKRKSTTS